MPMTEMLYPIYTGFLIFSGALYFAVWLCLIKRRSTLDGSFYGICILLGITDLPRLAYIIVVEDLAIVEALNWMQTVLTTPLLNKTYFLLSLFFNFYLFYVNLFGVFLITLNRYTAILRPMKHEQIWSPARCKLFFKLSFLLPLILPAFVALLVLRGCEIGYVPNQNHTDHMMTAQDQKCFELILIADWLFGVCITLPLLIGFHVRMIVALRRRLNIAHSRILVKAEARLMLVGLSLVGIFVLMQLVVIGHVIQPLYHFFADHVHPEFWWGAYRVTVDSSVVSNVYLLLICSTEVRKEFVPFLLLSCRRSIDRSMTPVEMVKTIKVTRSVSVTYQAGDKWTFSVRHM